MRQRKMLHTTVRILAEALAFHVVELFFAMIYHLTYLDSGLPSRGLRIVYRCFAAVAETEIVLFLILLAKGWTVVRRKITPQGRVKITAFIAIYGTVQFAVVTWEATVGSDPATVTYLHETPPGYVLLGLRLYALIWFVRAILITRVKYERKRGFYWKFALAGCLWILALPIQVLIAQSLPLYKRKRFIYAFQASCNILFFICQFILFTPSKYNRAFPFHAKTSDMQARPPASTAQTRFARRMGGNASGSGAQNFASGGVSGGVEMTPHGAVFRKHGAAAGAGTGKNGDVDGTRSAKGLLIYSNAHPTKYLTLFLTHTQSHARVRLHSRFPNDNNAGAGLRRRPEAGGRTHLSGGLALGQPEERVRASMKAIRLKISQLTDHSDDLEYALDELNLHDWDDVGAPEEDYDLPGSRETRGGPSAGNASSTSAGRGGQRQVPRPPPEDP